MSQINAISKYDEKSQAQTDSNRFETCEAVVEDLVHQGLPRVYSPATFISKIAKFYGITPQEARTCLKLAVKQLESSRASEAPKQEEEQRYAQSGYFYPSQNNNKKDGMDSLSSLGSYNRLMFAIK